ncbi:hypothetical protein HYW17_05680 [Candidatus Uhrbacteria bacterium]|nr:hypothetical protein [Candidatus Uhrbacteria bacterium]
MDILASTLDIIGKIMVAYTALSVHRRVQVEHKIDRTVFRAMKREQHAGVAGIVFMVFGYLLHVLK